jgi:hypothetical protein
MRLESLQPKTESEFYSCLRGLTFGDFFYERIEPANESGFPDIYFVARDATVKNQEGTIELKYAGTVEPNLRSLARGSQKSALLDYYEAGGRRRFALCYTQGRVFFWDTPAFFRSLVGDGKGWTDSFRLDGPEFRGWLKRMMTA